MKALVVSGGGSKGAFAGGIIDYLVNKENKKYNLFVGSSTGALLLPLAAIGNLEKLNTAYTSVNQEDIFKINPFKIKSNKNGQTKITLKKTAIIKNILPRYKFSSSNKFPWFNVTKIDGKKSFGDSSILKDLIKKFVTEKDFSVIREKDDLEIIVAVTNLTTASVEYKSSKCWGYNDYVDWMHASASAYPFMSIVIKENMQYIDGGTLEATPIQEAIDRGATEIDVIVLREENPKYNPEYVRNLFHGIIKVNELMWAEINRDDIRISQLSAQLKDVKINIYYTPRRLTNNSLVFDHEIMTEWWKEGYSYAEAKSSKSFKVKCKK